MLKIIALALVLTSALSCSQSAGELELGYSQTARFLIPSAASSCLATRSATPELPPEKDIQSKYFYLKSITFKRRDVVKTMVITYLKISVDIPGNPYTCVYGGDNLASLSDSWWRIKEASVAPGSATFATDCSLYCGGVDVNTAGIFSGTIEVYGYQVGDDLEEKPFKVQSTLLVENID